MAYYIQHHGIKGQKWGIRRFQNEDGSLTSAGKSRYGTNITLRERIGEAKRASDRKKQERNESKRRAVRKYSKTFDKASATEDRSDELFKQAKAEYQALGKNFPARVRRVMKNDKNDIAVQHYIKTFDEASRLGDEAYDLWQEAHRQHRALGRTYVGRVFTAIKYDY